MGRMKEHWADTRVRGPEMEEMDETHAALVAAVAARHARQRRQDAALRDLLRHGAAAHTMDGNEVFV